MVYLIVKALLSGTIIMTVSEIARRSPAFGARHIRSDPPVVERQLAHDVLQHMPLLDD